MTPSTFHFRMVCL